MSIPTVVQNDGSLDALIGRIADEFTQRLNRGERPSIEEYAAKYPEIASLLREVLPALGLIRQPDVEAAMAAPDGNLGTPLGDFRLVREIGRGGMGVVYLALQLSLNRRVALKVLPFAATLDPRHLQRFKNEAQAAGNLHHEHIVPVHGTGCERGVHYYAMQYIEGLTLAAVIHEMRSLAGMGAEDPQPTGPHPPLPTSAPDDGAATSAVAKLTTQGSIRSPAFFDNVARLGVEAAEGLEHAHQMGVVHRDIKPGNLLVDARGSLWITDFGLAQMRSDVRLTVTGELLGTLRYMSPEQALAKRVPVDHRTDIYSLGVTLYELLTLEPVFKGRDRQELLRQISFDDPKPPRRVNPHLPRDLDTIVSKAMAKAPARRYASAQELADDLQRFLDRKAITARPPGMPERIWRGIRKRTSTVLLGLATFVATGIMLFVVLHPPHRPTVEEEEARQMQEALAVHTQDLDAGRKVTLIGEHGWPGYYRWRTDSTLGKVTEAAGYFTVQHWEYGLLELLPDPRLARYRISAEVRHQREPLLEGRVGIYFAHSEVPAGGSSAHFYCTVAFNDLIDMNAIEGNPQGKGNSVRLQAHRQPGAGILHHTANVLDASDVFTPAAAIGELGPWRRIQVEFRPEVITVFWEGKCIATTPRGTLLLSAQPLFAVAKGPLDMFPQFAPRDGLGLFVTQGVASFRNVTIDPLD